MLAAVEQDISCQHNPHWGHLVPKIQDIGNIKQLIAGRLYYPEYPLWWVREVPLRNMLTTLDQGITSA